MRISTSALRTLRKKGLSQFAREAGLDLRKL
jgi:ribosomal protein L28